MTKLELSQEEEIQIKTICEYLFFDEFTDYATYNRFEQCFQPLFNNVKISLDKVFRIICGEKRKYINYKRFINSYLLYKEDDPKDSKLDQDLKIFFEKIFTSILIKEENSPIGKPQENAYIFSTPKTCKNRDSISMIQVLSDKEGAIHGLIIEYDNLVKNKLYPKKLEYDLEISLDMKLIIDEDQKKEELKEDLLKDAVTHVFGTISQNTGLISFLGFKCVSGKTVFVGYPEGEGFLFGRFGKKFHEIKMQMSLEGIILLQPGFIENIRTNYYLNTEASKLTKEDLKKDGLIKDEVQLSKLTDEIQIDKMITVSLIEEKSFLNDKLVDKISGNDYKEVVNQNARKWILEESNEQEKKILGLSTVDDALKEYEKEIENSKNELKEIEKSNAESEHTGYGGKRKKKKKRAKNGKLSESISLVDKTEWNGKNENVDNFKPIHFLKNKEEYKKLKAKIGQEILAELTQLKGYFSTEKGKALINQVLLEKEKTSTEGTKGEKKERKNLRPHFKKKVKEKKCIISTKNMKGEKKQIILNTDNKTGQSEKKTEHSDTVITGEGNENNPFSSDAQNIKNFLESMYNENSNIIEYLTGETKMRNKKPEDSEKNWRLFGNKIKRLSGIFLLQTIGAIIKAMRILGAEIDGKMTISLKEKIKLHKLLDENEDLVEFITQEQEGEKDEKTAEEEQILIPSEHPEKITSLPELEQKLLDIYILLDKKNLKSEDKKKLEQLKKLYLQQKNILIENKTENLKNNIIKQNKIDIDKIIKEEKEERKKVMEKTQKKIEEKIKKEEEERKKVIEEQRKKMQEKIQKEQAKAKEEKSIDSIGLKDKIFRNQEIYKGNKPWEDDKFKPEKNSLCPFKNKDKWILPEDAEKDDIKGWNEFKWDRVENIYNSNNYSVFYKGIEVEDIIQGYGIGDCYFLSVLGSLCKFPQLIEKLFYFKEKTKEHIYGIYLYINGIKKLILIDDYFPYIGDKPKKFAMSYSRENEIWVSLIEKAWAKVNGNYIRIASGGSPNESFDVLTEAYNEEVTFDRKSGDVIWQKIKEGKNKGFVMTAGTYNMDYVERVGLKAAHCYTILDIYEIKGEKVIRLRNPWGEEQFHGDWSDNSSKWTEILKKKYKFDKKEDGDFYIGYTDFLYYFYVIGFAKLHPHFTCSRLKVRKEQAIKCQLIKVTIPQDNTLVYFNLYGKNPRIPNKEGKYPKTSLSNLILVDKDFNYIDSIAENKMHICVEGTLNKGDYYLFCDANFRYNTNIENHGYTITAYCGIHIPMENVTEKKDVKSLLRKVVIDYCQKKVTPSKVKKDVYEYITSSFNKDLPYKVVAYENNSDINYTLSFEIKCKGEKSCSFYCDDVAGEDDIRVVKTIEAKKTTAIIIMYHSKSSLFDICRRVMDYKKVYDPFYNHPVFDKEGEFINLENTLKQYILEKDKDTVYIGIENTSKEKTLLKLILTNLKVNDGPYKDQATPIFELGSEQRRVFTLFVIGKEAYFMFDLA